MTARVSPRCLESYAIEVGCRIAHSEGCVDPTPLWSLAPSVKLAWKCIYQSYPESGNSQP